ncbi:MAG: hypothetical protein DRP01_05050 [Archaeoglobales archaeon]|nr:MAG: hypothetical protein DRP01_05050 [Archaeoglobales archaeon]
MLTLRYVNRKVNSFDGIVGDDDIVKKVMKDGFALIYGLPGVGKTSTALYLAFKFLKEGWRVVILRPAESIESEGLRIWEFEYNGEGTILLSIPFYYDVLTKESDYLVKMGELIFKSLEVAEDREIRGLMENLVKGVERDYSKLLEMIESSLEDVLILKIGDREEFLNEISNVSMAISTFISALPTSISQNLSVVLAGFGLLLALTSLAKLRGYEAKFKDFEAEKLKNVLVVVDDYEDIRGSREDVARFLRLLIDFGVRVLVVKRSSYNLDEFFNVVKNAKRKDEVLNILRSSTGLDLKREDVFFMFGTERDEFEAILRRNFSEDDLKGLDLDVYYRATFGMPYLAVALIENKVEPVVKDVDIYWKSKPFTELSLDDVHAMLRCMAYNMLRIYRKIKVNFAMVPLLIQPVWKDDLKLFCERVRVEGLDVDGVKVGCMHDLDRGDVVKREIEGKTLYDLEDKSKKLRDFVNCLFEIYEVTEDDVLKSDLESLRSEVIDARRIMLEIVTERLKEVGEAWYFETYHALENARFLIDKEGKDFWLTEALAHWCGYALQNFPAIGFRYWGFTFDVVKDAIPQRVSVYHLNFLFGLVSKLRLREVDLSFVEDVLRGVEGLDVEAWKIEILSMIASVKDYWVAKEFFENLHLNLSGDLRDYVEIFTKLDYADMCLNWGKVEDAKGILEGLREKIDDLLSRDWDEGILRHFEVYGRRRVRKALKGSLNSLKSSAHYKYGRALMDLDKLEKAVEEFEKAKKIYEDLKIWDGALTCESFIRRIRAIQGSYDFEDLIKKAEEVRVYIDDLTYSSIVAEFLVWKALRGEVFEDLEKELKSLNPKHRRITSGVLSVLGFEVQNVLELLKEFEVEVAFKRFDDMLLKPIERLSRGVLKSLDNPIFNFHIGEFAKGNKDTLKSFLNFFGNAIKLCKILRGFHWMLKVGVSLDELTRKGVEGKAFEILSNEILNSKPVNSAQAFARILRLYLKPLDRRKNLEEAIEIAEEFKAYPPLPSRLFKEMADALREEGDVKEAVVKLFYYHF